MIGQKSLINDSMPFREERKKSGRREEKRKGGKLSAFIVLSNEERILICFIQTGNVN